jgi:phospholipid/cholesterol/gamma-HCH transport system substrate-binding protein
MNKEIKIGIVAVLTIITLFVGVNYLKGLNILNNDKVYYAKYENIGGLQVGSTVNLNGFKVGMVSNIDLILEDRKPLLVTISLERSFNIPVNSVCKIINQDLMGTKGVDLILSDATNFLNVGDTLLSSIQGSLKDEVNAQILPLKRKAEELISSVDSVMMIVTAVLNKDARENLRNSLRSLDKTFELMSHTMVKVDSMIEINDDRITRVIINLESISGNIKSSNSDVKTILSNFATISDSLANSNISLTLRNISELSTKINNGEGSIGLLLKDEDIYLNFEKSTRELAELLEDIKKNPSRYVNFSLIGGSKPYKSESRE